MRETEQIQTPSSEELVYMNILRSRLELGVRFNDTKVEEWINDFVDAIRLFHKKQGNMVNIQDEFGLQFADELPLSEGSPILLVTNPFLIVGNQALIAMGKVTGKWEEVNENQRKLRLNWRPVITYEKFQDEKTKSFQIRLSDNRLNPMLKNPYFIPAYSERGTVEPFMV